ncbi:GH92 family glycosyl hydrolase [Parafilimonas sp.]|uniref:GH92 family glycosyl hydrolase n=1 Tax=Parafilimonas sp. TaxID=1969739 RepID=UPI0039E4B6E2
MRHWTLFFMLASVQCIGQQITTSNLQYVDPTIGGVGIILEPVRPTVQLPNCMLRVYPFKKDQLDDQVSHFPLNVASHRLYWNFSFLPVSGGLDESIWTKKLTVESETTTPYYYRVTSEDGADEVEYTTAERSGFFRVSFKGNEAHYLRFGTLNQNGALTVADKRTISGSEDFAGMKAYFYAELDKDILDLKRKEEGGRQLLLAHVADESATVGIRYAISYISAEQAKYNLQQEIKNWDFAALKTRAYKIWDKELSKIQVTGGSLDQKKVFYTALYRCYERMVNINEYGKYYSAYDHQVHNDNEPFYVDNWLWDTYRALEPLHIILDPEKETAKIHSYITMYEQTGWMPSFALVFGDWPAMTGNNAAIWITDAWMKGLRGFNAKKAYEGMRKGSLESTLLPWNNGPATSLDSFYNEHGYMPGLAPGARETVKQVDTAWEKRQAVSVTLDNSYSDWCIAQLAPYAGRDQDRALFLRRSEYYKNVFRTDKGFVWPKDKNGNWIEPFDPKLAGREYFTELNGYTFNWDVMHDWPGLFQLMGGKKKAEEKLDQLFREDAGLPKFKFWQIFPDASGLTGQFVMGNEPSFHIPYLYNYLGAPWKTQKRIRMLLNTWFPANLFGMPGDEDGGGMSAFIVFSMMGFFQVTPGVPVYNIGSPVFSNITIQLPNGKQFRITAQDNSKENKYIQEASLNGIALNKPWFTHEALAKGGVLKLQMGPVANKQWGSGDDAAPPSGIR